MMLIMTKSSKMMERRKKMMRRPRTIMMRIRQIDDDFKKADFLYTLRQPGYTSTKTRGLKGTRGIEGK